MSTNRKLVEFVIDDVRTRRERYLEGYKVQISGKDYYVYNIYQSSNTSPEWAVVDPKTGLHYGLKGNDVMETAITRARKDLQGEKRLKILTDIFE